MSIQNHSAITINSDESKNRLSFWDLMIVARYIPNEHVLYKLFKVNKKCRDLNHVAFLNFIPPDYNSVEYPNLHAVDRFVCISDPNQFIHTYYNSKYIDDLSILSQIDYIQYYYDDLLIVVNSLDHFNVLMQFILTFAKFNLSCQHIYMITDKYINIVICKLCIHQNKFRVIDNVHNLNELYEVIDKNDIERIFFSFVNDNNMVIVL
jgi:hypothetical protein